MYLREYADSAARSLLNAPAFQKTGIATTVCLTSAAAISSAFAQTAPQPDQTAQANTDPLEEIKVNGLRPLINDKLPDGLQDTPQSVDVITQKTLKDQGVTRLQDALKNVPGITFNSGEGTARGDTVNLRGFSAFDDFFLDGIRDAAIYTRDAFDLDSVEVLKGPSAVLFGRGSTGGVINQVSKAPTMAPLQSGTIQLGTNDEVRATADVDQPLTDSSAVRLNAMSEHSEIAGRPNTPTDRWGVAPSYAWGVGQDTTLVFSYLHQETVMEPDVGFPFVNGQPAPVSRTANFGALTDRNREKDDIGTLRLKHDFGPNLTVSDTLRYANYWFNYYQSSPNFGSVVPTPATPLSTVTVGRDDPASTGTQTNIDNQTDLTARFDTGFLSHVLVGGMEFSRQTSDLGRYNNPFNSNNTWVPRTPLLNPNPNVVIPFEPITSDNDTTAYAYAGYLIDTVHIGQYFDVTGGLRYDRFDADFTSYTITTGVTTKLSHVDTEWSPRAAIVFKPDDIQSYYFSYGTSFDPSAEALSLSAKTANLAPVTAHTYEAGAKAKFLGGMLTGTGAVFQTEVDNAQTNDPDNPVVTVLAGDQRVNGLELGLSGYITEQWEITAGYTYLDAKTIASGTANTVGKFLQNTARNNFNLWVEYNPYEKWEFGAGLNYVGKRFADPQATVTIPGYTVLGAMASYQVNDYVKVQLNGNNLTNETYFQNVYYTSAAENHAVLGAGRSVQLTTSFNF